MRSSDLQREENYNEYLRLLHDDDYYDVTYDEKSGGMSAVHKLHKFAKMKGVYGMRHGEYERVSLDTLRISGYRATLEAENNAPGIKVCDGYLDDIPMEIKAVESFGIWAICTKLLTAEKQHARCVVLLFPKDSLFTNARVADGIGKYMANPNRREGRNIEQIIAVSNEGILGVWNKIATPIEGWSIEEGLRGQNGANPFTIPPSDAKV